METPRFTKRVENFECENCGHLNQGSGFTNHCCRCLWSKHVDCNPGDRGSACHGLMEPIGLRKKKGEMDLVHRCVICGLVKPNKTSLEDDQKLILALPVLLGQKK